MHVIHMCMRSLFSLLLALPSFWLAGCNSPATAAGVHAPKPGEAKITEGSVPVLEIGLSTGAIREKLGQPVEIKPMESADGKAEVWVYHFAGPLRVAQIATGMKSVPTTDTADLRGEIRMVQEPQYSLEEQKTVVTLNLLMFNGQLAAQTTQTEQSNEYK